MLKLARKVFNRMDDMSKALVGCIVLYLFLYIWVDFVEVVASAILSYIL